MLNIMDIGRTCYALKPIRNINIKIMIVKLSHAYTYVCVSNKCADPSRWKICVELSQVPMRKL